MNTRPSRLRTVALAATAATTAMLMSGFLPPGIANADHGDPLTRCVQQLRKAERRSQRATTRAHAYKAAYDEMRTAMRRMETVSSRRVRDGRTRAKLQRIASNAQRRAAAHLSHRGTMRPMRPAPPVVVARPTVVVARPTVVVAPPPAQPAYYGPQRITRGEFKRFQRSVRREAFDRNRVALVRDMAGRVAFSSRQVASLMRLCTFDQGRINIAATLYRNVADPASWFHVYDTLMFQSSKKKLRKRLRRRR